MAFLNETGLAHLWAKIKTKITEAVDSITWVSLPNKPEWIGDNKPEYTATEVGAISTDKIGTASGVASLDSTGKVPVEQLPASFNNDVINGYFNEGKFYSDESFETEITGEEETIYIDLTTDKCYRYDLGTSTYIEVSSGVVISTITNEEIDTICADEPESTEGE